MSELLEPQFWLAALQIVWINILLSGDNAVVIAMACRDLPPRQRRLGLIAGAAVSSTLLILFTVAVTALMRLPYLRLISAVALLWIAIKLVGPSSHRSEAGGAAAESLRRAIGTILVADMIMSLDNVVAVAAVAQGRYLLLGLSLAVSIPVVYGGSAMVMALLRRFPIIIWAGGALLGFVAGELFVSDPVLSARALPGLAFGIVGAAIVIATGALLRWRRTAADGGPTTEEDE
jgi:YjbE family integral membrane protein